MTTAKRRHLSDEHRQLAILLSIYVMVFFWLAYRRYSVFGWDSGDFGNFHDMFWWTFRGKPFYFASRDMSNFGLHAAFLWVQLLPVFWLFPGVTTLICMQSLFLGLAGIPVYLIARELFNHHRAALIFTLAYLFYPPIVSQHVNQIEEPSFIAVYLLFAFYFFMRERFGKFLLFAAIACLGRENIPLAIAMFGIYAAILRRGKKWIWAPLALGTCYFMVVTFFIMPWFRAGADWDPTSRMFTYLGNTPGSIVTNALTHPGLVIQHLATIEIIQYLVLLVQPLAWVLPFMSPASLMALPDLVINLVADNNAMRVIPWHYNVVTGTFFFIGTLFSLKKWIPRLEKSYFQGPIILGVSLLLLVLSLSHWHIWFSPSQFLKLREHDNLVRALRAVPPDKSVLVPANLQGHASGREHWDNSAVLVQRPEHAAKFEYIVLNANERRFGLLVTQDLFDSLYRNPRYRLIFAEQGVFVFHRADANPDWGRNR